MHHSFEGMDLTSATKNHTQSVQTHCSGPLQQGNGFSFNMPTNFEKSIQVLLDLNHRMKALSFSPSLNESLHDQRARNDEVSGDEGKGNLSSGKKEKVNYATLNTEKTEDAEDELTPPFYHQICELKDALKDAVLKFNSF
ncbi:uncharacterized protein LOC124163177 isoform X2 [Ischnura elegans]|nr:uncharacterized protein LOC124163177 isoform X2 [Ischnura elegans]